jgi:acyl-CoA thioesterase-1
MGKINRSNCFSIAILVFFQLGLVPLIQAQKASFTSEPVKRVAINAKYEYRFSALDSAGNVISYSCEIPSWLQFDKSANTLSGKTGKPGQYRVEISAATKDAVIKQQFMLTVYNRQTLTIWPIGNSITNGTSIYNSYRRDLWQLLHAGHYNIDFIGSWDKHHMGGNVPDPDFDMDHDGHSGWTAHHILEPPDWDKQRGNIDQWLKGNKPDIVLIELGTNDVFQCVSTASAMNDLSVIIDKLRTKNASVKILMAQIPPLGDQWSPKKLCGTDTAYGKAIGLFNAAVVRLARSKTTARSPVIAVDQFTGVDPSKDMYDDIHPNRNGEKKMARRWYKALQPFLTRLK